MCSISVVCFYGYGDYKVIWTWSRWRSQKQGFKSLNPTTCHLLWLQDVFGGRSPTKNASLHRWWWLHHPCLSLRSFLSCGVSQSGSGTGQGIQVHQKSIGKIMFNLITYTWENDPIWRDWRPFFFKLGRHYPLDQNEYFGSIQWQILSHTIHGTNRIFTYMHGRFFLRQISR